MWERERGVSVNSCSPRARGAPSGEKRDTLGQPTDDAGPYIISVHRDESHQYRIRQFEGIGLEWNE